MWQDMIFSESADDPCRVLIPATIAKKIGQFRQDGSHQHEAGGVLLGLRRGPHIEVIKATIPMAGDIRTMTSFLRRDPGHFEIAQRLWRESNGMIGFVGEWHTHPEQYPVPSNIDTAEWRKILRIEKRATIFVIVGTIEWLVARGPTESPLGFLGQKWKKLMLIEPTALP